MLLPLRAARLSARRNPNIVTLRLTSFPVSEEKKDSALELVTKTSRLHSCSKEETSFGGNFSPFRLWLEYKNKVESCFYCTKFSISCKYGRGSWSHRWLIMMRHCVWLASSTLQECAECHIESDKDVLSTARWHSVLMPASFCWRLGWRDMADAGHSVTLFYCHVEFSTSCVPPWFNLSPRCSIAQNNFSNRYWACLLRLSLFMH